MKSNSIPVTPGGPAAEPNNTSYLSHTVYWDGLDHKVIYSFDGQRLTIPNTGESYDIRSDNLVLIVGKYQLARFRVPKRGQRGDTKSKIPVYAEASMEDRIKILLCFLVATGRIQAQPPQIPSAATPIVSRSAEQQQQQHDDDAAASGEVVEMKEKFIEMSGVMLDEKSKLLSLENSVGTLYGCTENLVNGQVETKKALDTVCKTFLHLQVSHEHHSKQIAENSAGVQEAKAGVQEAKAGVQETKAEVEEIKKQGNDMEARLKLVESTLAAGGGTPAPHAQSTSLSGGTPARRCLFGSTTAPAPAGGGEFGSTAPAPAGGGIVGATSGKN